MADLVVISSDDEEQSEIIVTVDFSTESRAESLVNRIIRDLKRVGGVGEAELCLARAKFSKVEDTRRSSAEFLDKLQALSEEHVTARSCSSYMLRFLDVLSDQDTLKLAAASQTSIEMDSSEAGPSGLCARDNPCSSAQAAAHPNERYGRARKIKHTERNGEVGSKRVELLERKLRKLDREIRKLDETEVDFDDMESEQGTYILQDKLKRQLVNTWKKLCTLTGESPDAIVREPRIHFKGTPHRKLNKALAKYARRSVDFPSVDSFQRVLTKACAHYAIEMDAKEILQYSRLAKNEIGKQLQRHRRKHFWEDHGSWLTDDVVFGAADDAGSKYVLTDPAEEDEELKVQLRQNYHLGQERLEEVFESFTNLSEQMRNADLGCQGETEANGNVKNEFDSATSDFDESAAVADMKQDSLVVVEIGDSDEDSDSSSD